MTTESLSVTIEGEVIAVEIGTVAVAPGGGSGDVAGPESATDDALAVFDGTTGKLLAESTVTGAAVALHLSSTSNPHSVTAAQVGADAAGTASSAVAAFAATLGDSAGLDVGTTAGTVAAGDHTHTQFTTQSQATWEAGVGTTESVVSPAKVAAAIAALGGGGGGTKSFCIRSPLENQPPAASFATLDTRNGIPVLDFDAAADESAIFSGFAPEAIVLTSGIIARIVWAATSATFGNVRWRVKFERRTTDQDSDSWDTATEATDATNGTSGICEVCEITCTTIDSIVAGDSFRVCITRVGTDGTNDTMTGDAELFGLELRAA